MSTDAARRALIDRGDLVPVCPHCEHVLEQVLRRGTGFPLGQGRTAVYFCPHRREVLGFAQRRAL